MKNLITLLTFLVLGTSLSFGQVVNDSIEVKTQGNRYEYYKAGQSLTMTQMENIMKPNEQAYKKIKSAKSAYGVAKVLGYAGGFMIGYPLGTAIGGGDANWELLGAGAAILVVIIPINVGAKKKTKKAVDLYNQGLTSTASTHKPQLNLAMINNGFGLTLNF